MWQPRSHPRSTFYFFVQGDLGDDVYIMMDGALDAISRLRDWTLGPPKLIDSADEGVRTIGGSLDLYTALPPFGEDLPTQVDREHYHEVATLVEAMTRFSEETGLEVSFQLDETHVGVIQDGVADRLVKEGLLGEWKRVLGL